MSRKILVIGAGRSSTSLIDHLLKNAETEGWTVAVGDQDEAVASEKVNGHPNGEAFAFNALDDAERAEKISESDFVISMLPARFHHLVVRDCIHYRKDIITPSYVSADLLEMKFDIDAAGICVLNEMGLDPGIDHMSAMKVIDEIRSEDGDMTRFESFTGGLIAPESDNNPWNYKFTWNPRNVVLAGQGGVTKYKQEGRFKYIPYHQLFRRVKPIEVGEHGMFEGYANRDSLKYQGVYGLEDIPTIYRGTLRRTGYSEAWHTFVRLGMTDDTYQMDEVHAMTWRKFINAFLVYHPTMSVEDKLRDRYGVSDEVMAKLEWLGLFDDKSTGLKSGTPATILQHLLEQKWGLDPDDKDMIVMWHRFGYSLNGQDHEKQSYMVVTGDDNRNTAMSKTVGLPVAIACCLMLKGKLDIKGLQLPVIPEVYLPVLAELEKLGITFTEKQIH